MLLSCKPKCSGKKGNTNGVLDVEKNVVVCEYCLEELNVSSFSKDMMKKSGDTLKKKPKALQFKCETCNKTVSTEVNGVKLVGKDCKDACKFNVTDFFVHALKTLPKEKDTENEG